MTMTDKHLIGCTIIWLILLTGLVGCNNGEVTPTVVPDLGPDLIIEAPGGISLKRETWIDYLPASIGTEVRLGDLLNPNGGQPATILCADLSLQTVKREMGHPCQVEKPVLRYGRLRIFAGRADAAPPQIPYILFPRNTSVLYSHPLLSWHDTGSISYTVAILQGSQVIWEQSGVRSSEIRYPQGAPSLEPGTDYLLSVVDETSGYHSGQDVAKGLGFQVLSKEDRAIVEATSRDVLALPLGDAERRFVLAIYYAGLGLRGEALVLLNDLSSGMDSPIVQLWRGDLLTTIQLPGDAENAYRAALTASEKIGDVEAQAGACIGLWRTTRDQAWLDEAIKRYEAIGDHDQAQTLRQELGP